MANFWERPDVIPDFANVEKGLKNKSEPLSRSHKPLALVISYSDPDTENRVKTQIKTLLKAGFEVHTLGWGTTLLNGVSRHFSIKYPGRVLRLLREVFSLAFLKPELRFKVLRLSRSLLREIDKETYSLVINHDLELLPLICDRKFLKNAFGQAIRQVDLHELHEYTPSQLRELPILGKSLEAKYRNYQTWLLHHVSSPEIDIRSVVGKSIGNWYVDNLGLADFIVIRNVSQFRERSFERRNREELHFVHHGKYSPNRGLEKLVKASKCLRNGDTLTFILNGDKSKLEQFQAWANKFNPEIKFLEPVKQDKVPQELSKFDVEIILFEPVTENLRHTLPNKVFEAIQGDLAVIVGPNPDLAELITTYGIGKVLDDWSEESLSEALPRLTRSQIENFRRASFMSSFEVSIEAESKKLLDAWSEIL